MQYDVNARFEAFPSVAMVLHDSTATALADYMDGNVLTLQTDDTIKVCGDTMYFLGNILPVEPEVQSLLELE